VGTICFSLFLATEYRPFQLLKLLAQYFVIAIILSLAMLPIPTLGWMSEEHAGCFRGAFIHKNVAGAVFALGIATLWCWFRTARFRTGIIWLSLASMLLLLTQSISALMNVNLAAFGTICLFPLRWRIKISLPVVLTMLAVGYSAAIALVFNYETILLALGRDSTLSGRTELWRLILQLIGDRPFFGYGIDAVFGYSLDENLISLIEGWPVPHAHNGWLSLLLDYGIVGTALYIAWFGHTAFRAIANFRRASRFTKLLAVFPVFCVLFILSASISEEGLFEFNHLQSIFLFAIAMSQQSGYVRPLFFLTERNVKLRSRELHRSDGQRLAADRSNNPHSKHSQNRQPEKGSSTIYVCEKIRPK
jgi:O-antigen ligase